MIINENIAWEEGVQYQTHPSCIIIGFMYDSGCQMLPFNWTLCVTCAVIIRESGIILSWMSLPGAEEGNVILAAT